MEGPTMQNLDSFDGLISARPPEPQPDWAEEDIKDRPRQQKLPLQTMAPWETEEALLEELQQDAADSLLG